MQNVVSQKFKNSSQNNISGKAGPVRAIHEQINDMPHANKYNAIGTPSPSKLQSKHLK